MVDHRTVNSEGLWFDLSKRTQIFPSISICDKLTTCVVVDDGTLNLLYVTLRGILGNKVNARTRHARTLQNQKN